MITPAHVATHLNRAGHFYSMGMRAYYFLVPLVFWLFGPHFMLVSTIVLLMVLYRIDRAPKIMVWITVILNKYLGRVTDQIVWKIGIDPTHRSTPVAEIYIYDRSGQLQLCRRSGA